MKLRNQFASSAPKRISFKTAFPAQIHSLSNDSQPLAISESLTNRTRYPRNMQVKDARDMLILHTALPIPTPPTHVLIQNFSISPSLSRICMHIEQASPPQACKNLIDCRAHSFLCPRETLCSGRIVYGEGGSLKLLRRPLLDLICFWLRKTQTTSRFPRYFVSKRKDGQQLMKSLSL